MGTILKSPFYRWRPGDSKDKAVWSRSHTTTTELCILTIEMNHLWWKENNVRWALKNDCTEIDWTWWRDGGACPLISGISDTGLLAMHTKDEQGEVPLWRWLSLLPIHWSGRVTKSALGFRQVYFCFLGLSIAHTLLSSAQGDSPMPSFVFVPQPCCFLLLAQPRS